MEEKNKLALPISHFFLPLGMTMNMPGTAMYFPMITIFVAQIHGMSITFAKLIPLWSVKKLIKKLLNILLFSMYSVLQAMALPATPSGGSALAAFLTTCAIFGIENPLEVLAYTVTIDWLM